MIMTDDFIKWYQTTDSNNQKSAINFVIYTLSSMPIKSRLLIVIEILLGKKFCIWISRNQD